MEPSPTKVERQMDAEIARLSGDPERVLLLGKAKAFKRTWIELAAVLMRARDQESWKRWEFATFEEYCAKELHLRPGTVDKLCQSYGFLRANAPRLVRDDGGQSARFDEAVPSWEAVQYVAKAEARGAADEATLSEMKRAAFDEGATVPALARRFREVAFPIDDEEKRTRLRAQVVAAARRLADLCAEPDAGIPRKLAERVEELTGELAQTLGG